MNEQWVELEDYPNYAVSNEGRVWNMQRDAVLTPRRATNGALRVTLSHEGETKEYYIHQLVLMAFHGVYVPKQHIMHFDGDKENNRLENLRIRRVDRLDGPQLPIGDLAYERAVRSKRQWGKRVVVVETGDVFRNARDCAEYINGDYSNVYKCLRNEQGSHQGYTFQYYDEVA